MGELMGLREEGGGLRGALVAELVELRDRNTPHLSKWKLRTNAIPSSATGGSAHCIAQFRSSAEVIGAIAYQASIGGD